MITATIPHGHGRIPVEVVSAHAGIATVKTMNGAELFPCWTHGGWCYYNTKRLPAFLLQNIERNWK